MNNSSDVRHSFLDNKYTRVYLKIVAFRQATPPDGYSEKHHIMPFSLGGPNDRSNLVRLTAREHFVCHLLLTKMFEGVARYKMMAAIGRMAVSNKNGFRTTSRTFSIARKMHREAASLLGKGRKQTEEDKQKKRIAALNMPPELRKKVSDSTRIKSPQTIEKMRMAARNRPKRPCCHCGKIVAINILARYHDDNCKNK